MSLHEDAEKRHRHRHKACVLYLQGGFEHARRAEACMHAWLECTLVHVCTTMHDKRYKEGSSSGDLTNTCIIVFCMCMLARVLKNGSTPQAACLSAAHSLHPFWWSVPFVSLQASCCPESWEAGKADGAPRAQGLPAEINIL